ncbi:MAG: MFS transporter [Candidatus Comchoanobacterales bacterium]
MTITTSTSHVDTQPRIKLFKWLVCISASLFFLYDFIQMSMMNAIHDTLQQDFSLTDTQFGLVSSCYNFATVAFLLPCGALLDRFSARKILLSAMFVCVTMTFALSQANTFQHIVLCRIMVGATGAFCFLSAVVLSSRWFPSAQMGLVSSLIVSMAFLGGYLANGPFNFMLNHIGMSWQQAVFYDACFGVVLWLIMFLIIRDTPSQKHLKPHRQTQSFSAVAQAFKKAGSNPQNWRCGLYTSLMNIYIFVMAATWGKVVLTQLQGLTDDQAFSCCGIIFIGAIIGGPLIGRYSDAICKRRLPMQWGAVISLALSLMLFIPWQATFSPELSFIMVKSICFLIGISTCAQILSYPMIIESNPADIVGTSESISSILIMGIGALSLPVFGWILDHPVAMLLPWFNKYQQAYALIPLTFIAAWLITLKLRETFGKPFSTSP